MALMISVTRMSDATLVKVDGWLDGEGVAELERALSSAAAPVRLGCEDLRGANEAGISLLRRLRDEGMRVEGLSPYVRLMIASPES